VFLVTPLVDELDEVLLSPAVELPLPVSALPFEAPTKLAWITEKCTSILYIPHFHITENKYKVLYKQKWNFNFNTVNRNMLLHRNSGKA
jgi:hypothetical protein